MSQFEASPRVVAPVRGTTSAAGQRTAALGRCVPIALLVLLATWALAWQEQGSPNARDWLKYAAVGAFVLAGILLSGRASRPPAPALLALAALGGTVILVTISISYSAVPDLARDEALLTLFYATAFAVPALLLRSRTDRRYATAVVAAGSAGLAVFAALALVLRAHPESLFYAGRLNFPITYPNAQAAAMLLGYWPAAALAARRTGPVWLRALALGGATAILCGWLLSQSKGGELGLIASTIVVFALSRRRLRLLVPVALSAALAASGAVPLTAPIRAGTDSGLRSAIHLGGAVLLALAAAGAILGAGYALLDRRLELSPRARAISARLAVAAVVLVVVGGPVGYFAVVQGPVSFVTHEWRAFKVPPPAGADQSTHLVVLGSERYDMWRVALKEFVAHPLLGIGARGFGPAYLEYGRSTETPARAHSLPFDSLAETGIVGFLLLLLVFAPPIATVARGARDELTAAGLLGGIVYFVAHACVDWIWTVPAVGAILMLLLSIAAASAPDSGARPLGRRFTLAAAAGVVVVALVGFVPPWLSWEYAQRAAGGGAAARSDIAWAKRLDPLSIEPYVVQATRAGSLAGALVPLRQAVELQPRSYAAHYLYGINLLKAHEIAAARAQLDEAHRLSPRDPYVRAALRLLPPA